MKEKSNDSHGLFSTEENMRKAMDELSMLKDIIEKRAAELIIANRELAFQNSEKNKRAEELLIANKELAFQNEEKEKRATELTIANKELAFQNEEKHKRAAELTVANKKLASLNTEQQTLFASIVNSSDDAMFTKTFDGIITSWNHGAEKIFGYKAHEIIGKHIFKLIPLQLQHQEIEITKKLKNGETLTHYETERLKKDGTIFNASLTISPIRDFDGNIIGASKVLRDITVRMEAERNLVKANRMYAFISAINQMIVKTKEENTLFNEACRIAIDIGKFKMAWIGKIDADTKIVIPFAHAGAEDDYLTKMTPISFDNITEGPGPTGNSLREGRCVVCNDIENDPQMMLWQKAATERGYLSSIAFPITKFGKMVGAYSLYAPVKNFFDDEEIALLDEAASDISFALESIEKTAQHKKAEQKIKESEEIFHKLFDESADATLLLDDKGFTACNKSTVKLLGYRTKEEVIGRQPWQISPERQPDEKLSQEKAKEMMAKALQKGFNRFEWVHLKSDGSKLEVEVMLTSIILKGVQSYYTIWRDITEWKKAEEGMKLLTERLQLATESAGMGIWDWDIKNDKLSWDKGMYSIYDIKESQFSSVYEGWISRLHPEDAAGVNEIMQQALANKIDYNPVFRIIWPDSSVHYIKASGLIERDKEGNALRMIGTNRDITAKKVTELALMESEKEVRAIAESMPQIVWVTTADGKNIYFNQHWVDYTGLSLEQSYGDGWLISFHEEDKPIAWTAWKNAVENLEEYAVECRLKKYDGTYQWWLLRGVPKINEKGEIIKWYGTCTDIEKIKQAEHQLRKSEVFNRSVLNSLNAHLAVVNDKGDIVSVNEAWVNFALQNGETALERTCIGSNYFSVCEKASRAGEETAQLVLQGMKDVLNKQIKDFYIEYPCHSSTEQRWFGLRIMKFENDEQMILLVHTNLTERILAEHEREKITEDLIQRNQDLEQFTYIVSHNLRAPVANIKGLSDLLELDSLSKDDAARIAKDLASSVGKLDSVILDLNNILQLKKIGSEAKERVIFSELVKGIEQSIHSLVLKEKVTITGDFDEVDEMITLKGYLYSIFYNLISNSIKYKRQDVDPVIEIKTLLKKDAIELIFKDNGRGIDLKKRGDQVFGLYKRFHLEIEGKGVGLFIVKTQVEALGGKISIESEVNKGTQFKIIFKNQLINGN